MHLSCEGQNDVRDQSVCLSHVLPSTRTSSHIIRINFFRNLFMHVFLLANSTQICASTTCYTANEQVSKKKKLNVVRHGSRRRAISFNDFIDVLQMLQREGRGQEGLYFFFKSRDYSMRGKVVLLSFLKRQFCLPHPTTLNCTR